MNMFCNVEINGHIIVMYEWAYRLIGVLLAMNRTFFPRLPQWCLRSYNGKTIYSFSITEERLHTLHKFYYFWQILLFITSVKTESFAICSHLSFRLVSAIVFPSQWFNLRHGRSLLMRHMLLVSHRLWDEQVSSNISPCPVSSAESLINQYINYTGKKKPTGVWFAQEKAQEKQFPYVIFYLFWSYLQNYWIFYLFYFFQM